MKGSFKGQDIHCEANVISITFNVEIAYY